MSNFSKEFKTLNYVIRESDSILLFAHSRPDGDTIGSVLALKNYIQQLGKKVAVACYDPFPEFLQKVSNDKEKFLFPDQLDLAEYKLVLACDSVERGFEKILPHLFENQISAIIDHHPDITIKADITIIDPKFSSVCEMVYLFFTANEISINREMATCLMLGILSDTGSFQHANTTSQVMEISSQLVKKGARISKIIDSTLANKKISTLKLWGKAFERAKINPKNGMIASVITQKDLEDCEASNEDIAQVATILNTVPGTKFSLILSERENGIIKGSLRSELYKGVDVSAMAALFGGGGHKLASGFELEGKIVETEEGWAVE